MMIRAEAELGKKKKKNENSLKSRCAVCRACEQGRERKGGKRFKDTEDEMCDMR